MILVTTGTNGAPFDCLLRELDRLAADDELVVQHGPSSIRVSTARNLDYAHFDELAGLIRTARVVVTHGGVGSILVALANGHRPIVVPRLARFGEAVDDHQLDLARRLHDESVVVLVEDPSGLPPLVSATDSTATDRTVAAPNALAAELRTYLTSVISCAESGERAHG